LVVELLLKSDIAHNMVILWGSPFNQEEGSGSSVVRAVLVPRKPIYGVCSPPSLSSHLHLLLERSVWSY